MKNFEDFKVKEKDLFANHKAKLTKLTTNDGRDCIIEFKQDDTNVGAMMITYINGIISISGDYGYAMFDWYNHKNHILAYAKMNSFGYVLEKCVAKDKFTMFNHNTFEEDWNNWKTQLIEEGYNKEEVDSLNIPHVEDENDVIEFFKNFNKIDCLYEYGCYSFGMRTTWQTYAKWYGFQQATINAFKNEGF